MDLKTELSQFIGAESESDLFGKFKRLADNFLYGGYIQVRNEYRIYIQTVEFYFHSEKEDGIKDPIVYHRNGRELDEVPYFPLMTLHAHISGFDITFENPTLQYRASALIRAYEIKSKDGKYKKCNGVVCAFSILVSAVKSGTWAAACTRKEGTWVSAFCHRASGRHS